LRIFQKMAQQPNKPLKGESLADSHSMLAGQWHPSKNGDLTPTDVTFGSGRKVWWKCPKGDDHEWPAIIANRVKGSGCPICSNQRVAKSNSLATVNPELAKEWHPSKNGELTPFNVLPSATNIVWWQCSKNPEHEWKAKINNRANGKNCPICCNQKLVRENSLGVVNPRLAEQWHPTKNGNLTPFDVTPSAQRKVWWKCSNGDDHEWQATVNHRSTGTGCPKCNPVWSIPELRIYCELKSFFPGIQHRAKIEGHEIDIYIPEINIGIEYDGVYWHSDKLEKDKEKNVALSSSMHLIRIRENDLPLLSEHDIRVEKRSVSVSLIKNILRLVLTESELSPDTSMSIRSYLERSDWVANELFSKLYSERKSVNYEDSLSNLFPSLAQEWHPEKNDYLLPEHFTPGSGREIWWLGKCGHEWKDTINHRTSGRDCPKCRYKKASKTRRKSQTRDQLNLFDE